MHEPGTDALITGVFLIDGTGRAPQADSAVLLGAGRIQAIGRTSEFANAVVSTRIDAAGQVLMPGLIDAHVHLRREPVHTAGLYLAHGVTSVRDTGSSLDLITERRTAFVVGEPPSPRAWFTGPIIDTAPTVHPHLTAVVDSIASAERTVDAHAAFGVDAIKIYGGVRPAMTAAIIARARRHGLRCIGDLVDTKASEAIEFGIWSLEHATIAVADAVPPERRVTRRDLETLGLAEWRRRRQQSVAAVDPDGPSVRALVQRMAESGVYFAPTLVVFERGHAAGDPEAEEPADVGLMPPSVLDVWRGEASRARAMTATDRAVGGRALEALAGIAASAASAGARILVGSDTCNTYVVPGASLHRELQLLVDAGLSPMACLEAVTRINAQALGQERDLGTIETGKLADLLLLDKDPLADIRNIRTVQRVFLAGSLVYARSAPVP